MNIRAEGKRASGIDMLSLTREDTGSPLSFTRIFPLPSPSLPVSRGIDIVACELQAFEIDTHPLRKTARELDLLTTCASNALDQGDQAKVQYFLGEAINTMREAVLILKMVCIMERNQLPGCVLEHLALTRDFIQGAMNETYAMLNTPGMAYSGTA